MHAFHLHAVTDVDTCRANRDALTAIHTIPHPFRNAYDQWPIGLEFAALLTALVVVGHDHRILVQHRGLQTAIRTNERAGLLTETRENGEEQQREQNHEYQSSDMIAWIVRND